VSTVLHTPDATQPPYDYPDYTSTVKRHPNRPLIPVPREFIEIPGVTCDYGWTGPDVVDLTKWGKAEPLGERIIVAGRLLDEDGRPVRRALVEVWQANAAGRYRHDDDTHEAPLDPNFLGAGQVLTGEDGGFRFITIKPGAYPWRNTYNAWRPAHMHFSLFGSRNDSRLVTQMYFPGDPLLQYDPVIHSIADPAARERLVSKYDPNLSEAEWALGYRFDIVVRGRNATPMEH
jgi:protocatechuate 3,4-dioxygenase, beta subunit